MRVDCADGFSIESAPLDIPGGHDSGNLDASRHPTSPSRDDAQRICSIRGAGSTQMNAPSWGALGALLGALGV
eukprot:9420593-Pyramimonas_sp.AAC.1